nr:hypothetical protein [Lachnospiraceae bacterium]
MGYLAEQFREAYKKNEELNQVKLPKVSEDSKGYLKQVEMKNYYDNKVNLFRLSLKKVKFSINQLENVY